MKKIIKFIGLAFVLLVLSLSSFAQGDATTTADASATIVSPITIEKQADMEFGDIAVSATVDGTVELVPMGGVATRNVLGGVTLPAYVANVPTAARFFVQGVPDYHYSITLPDDDVVILTRETGTETMAVNVFTSNPSGTGGVLNGSGNEILYVGATLEVIHDQEPGHYVTLTPFSVTVNYN
jgi:hypothetical protein